MRCIQQSTLYHRYMQRGMSWTIILRFDSMCTFVLRLFTSYLFACWCQTVFLVILTGMRVPYFTPFGHKRIPWTIVNGAAKTTILVEAWDMVTTSPHQRTMLQLSRAIWNIVNRYLESIISSKASETLGLIPNNSKCVQKVSWASRIIHTWIYSNWQAILC